MSWSDDASRPVTLLLAGDVMTGRGIDQILAHPGDPELRESYLADAREYVLLAERAHGAVPRPVAPTYLWGDALEILADHAPQRSIVNLETSITTRGEFWPDKAVHYRMHPDNVACLQVAGIDLCTLANNHVLDFGRDGLLETLEVLHEAGISTAGAGRDLEQASAPARLGLGDGHELWLSSLGTESSGIPRAWAAGPSRPGVDLISDLSRASADEVAERSCARKRPGDLAVASIHWGSNWGHEIAPAQVSFAHRLIDRGVDLVHGHSSHHVRAIEVYRGKLVLYGCGDLVTDYEGIGGHEHFRGDLAAMYFATVALDDGRLLGLRLVPMQMKRMRLGRASRSDARRLERMLEEVSGPFGTHFDRDEDGLRLAARAGREREASMGRQP